MAFSGSDVEKSSGRFEEIVAEYVRACDEGRSPDRAQWIREHADFAEDLRTFFRLRDRTEELLKPLRSVAGRVLSIRCPHCRTSIELLDDSDVHSIRCSSCGSEFSLVDSSEMALPGGLERIGQFQFVEQVGVGQFGAVWKARDLSLERAVAIKIPRSRQLHATEVEMLLRDARVAAQLNHPHIVSVHEVGRHEDVIYIVSDFVEGMSLKEWMALNRPSVEESVRLCATISEAVHYAHQCGVVHRDLKPSNIMIDPAGEPHLVDFGLAKREAGELTMTVEGQILGTPAYMSPEQAGGQGHEVTRTADIYSLGVILFEMLTGELPFGGNRPALLFRIINDLPADPRSLNSKIPRDLSNICLKCLEKQPQDRYQTARELADDCRRYLAGEPVEARPLPIPVRAYRWSRKKPWLAGLWMTCALLLVGITIVASVGYLQTQTALGLANERADTIERNLYFAEMRSAGQAASRSDGLAEVYRLISHWRPENSRVDRRGWEWYYLDSLLHQDSATLTDPGGKIVALAWSSDGMCLASASGDHAIRIWGNDGKIRKTLAGHSSSVRDIAWNGDGSLLASASDDGQVRIWDVTSGACKAMLPHEGPVTGIAWGQDGQQIASASTETDEAGHTSGVIKIWNARTEGIQKQFDLPVAATALLEWNHGTNRIAVAPKNGKIVVIEAEDGEQVSQIGYEGQVFSSMAWSPDGTRLACDYFKGPPFIQVWSMDGMLETQIPIGAAVLSMAWHPNGAQIAYVDGNRTAKVYDVESKSLLRQFQGHLAHISALCWHPDGNRLATGDVEGKLKLWSTNSLDAMREGSAVVSWQPDTSRYASRIHEAVVLCDQETETENAVEFVRHQWIILDLARSPDSRTLASLDYAGEVHFTEIASGQSRLVYKVKLRQIGSRLPGLMTWSSDGRFLAVPFDDRTIHILDARTGENVRELVTESGELTALAWNPTFSQLASGSSDQRVTIWDTESGELIETFGSSEDGNCSDTINWSPDGCTTSLSWSPDGRQLACAASDTGLQIWTSSEEDRLRHFSGHTTYVRAVDWSPDGTRIASADESGWLRIWNAESGPQALTLQYPGGVSDLAWSPDGKSLAAVGYGGEAAVRIWTTEVDPPPAVLW